MQINKKISKYNFNPGNVSRIKYIVIHYCGAVGTAKNSVDYFAGGNRGASAHYFVGYNGEIWQSVEDANIAWHCGSKTYKDNGCRNANSIGIELCTKTKGSVSKADENWYFEDATVKSAIELTKELMKKYDVPVENVLRHFDVTGKVCPAPYVFNNGKHTWSEFKKAISGEVIKEVPVMDNSKKIWDFLKGCNLNNYAVAGIMGNLDAESGLSPINLQNSFEKKLNTNDKKYTADVDSGKISKDTFSHDSAGYGLAQWTFWSRKAGLFDMAKERGTSIGDLDTQLRYFYKEVSGNAVLLNKLKSAKTIKEASDAMLHIYERPADQSEKMKLLRERYSKKYYDKYATGEDPVESEEFLIRVNITNLNIRETPGGKLTGQYTGIGTFTITETQGCWGKLKSGAGWVNLDYVVRI